MEMYPKSFKIPGGVVRPGLENTQIKAALFLGASLNPPLSTVGWTKTTHFNNVVKRNTCSFLLQIVSKQANIRNTVFDQRSSRPQEVGVSRWRK